MARSLHGSPAMTTTTRRTDSRRKQPTVTRRPKRKPVETPAVPPPDHHQLSEKLPGGVDALGTELGQAFVENATGADDAFREHRDEATIEELGGPFIITTGETEFASGTDASNPIDAEREPFPTVSKPRRRGAP